MSQHTTRIVLHKECLLEAVILWNVKEQIGGGIIHVYIL